jgi:hypothetical protein
MEAKAASVSRLGLKRSPTLRGGRRHGFEEFFLKDFPDGILNVPLGFNGFDEG